MSQEETGKVKWFDGMADQYARTLEEGERVSFVVGQGQKGPAAEEVRRIA